MRNRKVRLFFIPQLLYRWRELLRVTGVTISNMIIVVNGKIDEEGAISGFIRTHYLPERLTLLVYLVDATHSQFSSFPVNMLRNLAIRNVKTSHYMIMDMDMWPTRKNE